MPDEIKISADNGYFSGANLRYLEQKGLDSYIPDVNTTKKMKGKKLIDNPYSKDKFEFNEEEDCFICPNGEVLTRKGEYEYNGKIQYHYYGANCKECPFKVDCVGKATTKQIISDDYEAERTHNLIIIWEKLKENSKLYAEFMQYCGFSDGISS